MKQKISHVFPVTVYQFFDNDENSNEILLKARVRIFYKGLNANQTYIDDEFAEKLMSTVSYCPVKGIYNEETEDFEDHGSDRQQGRIYGVVPEKHNFKWELHEDEDGVVREYACVDAYLYKGLYGLEVEKILDSSQSMELYPPSIKGEWLRFQGMDVWKFKDAQFLGLQALGEDVQPCFEGSSFYEEDEDRDKILFTTFFQAMETTLKKKQGEDQMKNITADATFAISDEQKNNLVSKEINQEHFRYIIVDSYDSYCVCYDLEEDILVKVVFEKKEDDTIQITNPVFEQVFAEYLTQDEKRILQEEQSEAANYVKGLEDKISEYEETLEDLNTYKKNIQTQEKEDVLTNFAGLVNEEVLEGFRQELDNFSKEDLEKELSYELVKANKEIFTKGALKVLPSVEPSKEKSKIARILDNY